MTNKVINDFSITVGTSNGSGSQTSNLTILRALFKMVHHPLEQRWLHRPPRRA